MREESLAAAAEAPRREAQELRDLLSAFLDSCVLRGFVVTKEQWERACLLCGRWCPPFVERQIGPAKKEPTP